MSHKYRAVQTYSGAWKIQRRILGFLWWKIEGFIHDQDEAQKVIDRLSKPRIIYPSQPPSASVSVMRVIRGQK